MLQSKLHCKIQFFQKNNNVWADESNKKMQKGLLLKETALE